MSETRAKILETFGVPFMQNDSLFDEEKIEEKNAKAFVYKATLGKFRNSLVRYGFEQNPILAADTVIECRGEILRKASTKDEARKTLLKQSGSRLSIITCMMYRDSKIEFIDLSETRYSFSVFDTADLESFLDGNEWMGKAGACMVEGFCKKYILSVEGYESCAMGLSIEKLLPFLKERDE